MRNRFCYLRRRFRLDSLAKRVPARVTADSRFLLYVNGKEVARGPARSIPERLAYIELDLAPHLKTGDNAIAALVRFYGTPIPWWQPARPSLQLGYGSFAFEAPEIEIVSDASWKGRAAPYLQDVPSSRLLPVPPNEILDGAEIPIGWQDAEFDDSRWKPAAELSAGTLAVNRTRIPVEPLYRAGARGYRAADCDSGRARRALASHHPRYRWRRPVRRVSAGGSRRIGSRPRGNDHHLRRRRDHARDAVGRGAGPARRRGQPVRRRGFA